jgi:Transcriptional regulatory protein, C terminal
MSSPHWLFGGFRLDPDNACLWRGAQAIALTPKAFDVLHYLVTHPDRLVSKDTLLDAVWPETAISDTVVRIAIGELRRALGDTAQASRFIATELAALHAALTQAGAGHGRAGWGSTAPRYPTARPPPTSRSSTCCGAIATWRKARTRVPSKPR